MMAGLTLAVVETDINAFGDLRTVKYEKPLYKLLTTGIINELKASVVDQYGIAIDNHGLPISVVLEIINNHMHLRRKRTITIDADTYAKTTHVDTAIATKITEV